jgi:hypothetical protein
LKDEINEKKSHIRVLEQRMVQSLETTEDTAVKTELSQVFFFLEHAGGLCIISLIEEERYKHNTPLTHTLNRKDTRSRRACTTKKKQRPLIPLPYSDRQEVRG